MKTKSLISIVGPTAIGKTTLAIHFAKYFETEIISADSRQFYKEMNIGTAVPSIEDLSIVPHHFIQHKSIFDSYSVGDYEKEALVLIEELFTKSNVIVMVGGSGLYVDAVSKGLDEFPKIEPKIRKELNNTLQTKGIKKLQVLLKALDPYYYDKVDQENPHRLIRALEICIGTGKPYSSFLNKSKANRPFKTITLGISAKRDLIYNRINDRVDLMMQQGLLEEAKTLYAHRKLNALQTVGYKELFDYLDGSTDLAFAISEIKKNTRRFAKRQLTWLNRNPDIIWVGHDMQIGEVLLQIKKIVNKYEDD